MRMHTRIAACDSIISAVGVLPGIPVAACPGGRRPDVFHNLGIPLRGQHRSQRLHPELLRQPFSLQGTVAGAVLRLPRRHIRKLHQGQKLIPTKRALAQDPKKCPAGLIGDG